MARCKAKAESGAQCRAKATPNGYCPIHEYPEKAAELSRKAVEARRRAAAEAHSQAEILPPKTPDELLGQLAEVLCGVKERQTGRAEALRERRESNVVIFRVRRIGRP